MRLNSLRSLLASMSTPHYHTIGVLMNHWQRYENYTTKLAGTNHHHVFIRTISSLRKEDPRINHLAQLLGPIILRPQVLICTYQDGGSPPILLIHLSPIP